MWKDTLDGGPHVMSLPRELGDMVRHPAAKPKSGEPVSSPARAQHKEKTMDVVWVLVMMFWTTPAVEESGSMKTWYQPFTTYELCAAAAEQAKATMFGNNFNIICMPSTVDNWSADVARNLE